MKRKTKIIIAVAIILVPMAIFGLQKVNGKVEVKQVQVYNQAIKSTISSTGSIKSMNEADLAFAATGRVTQINVEKGQDVRSGQLTAVLYALSQQETAEGLKNAMDVAIQNKEAYMEENEGDDNIDFRQSDDYKIQLKKYDRLIEQAGANYRSQNASIQNLQIHTPFAGTVIDIYREVGEISTAGTTVVKIANLNKLYFEAQVDQEDFGLIQPGQTAEIQLDAYEDITFTGTVAKLPRYAETDSSGDVVFFIEIELIPQEGHLILLAMEGDVDIIVNQTQDKVTALDFDVINYEENDSAYIWIAQDGKLKKMPIEIGLEGNLLTEVKTDLSNMTIVTSTDTKTEIGEGQKVKVAE